jgi:hypothetical protein
MLWPVAERMRPLSRARFGRATGFRRTASSTSASGASERDLLLQRETLCAHEHPHRGRVRRSAAGTSRPRRCAPLPPLRAGPPPPRPGSRVGAAQGGRQAEAEAGVERARPVLASSGEVAGASVRTTPRIRPGPLSGSNTRVNGSGSAPLVNVRVCAIGRKPASVAVTATTERPPLEVAVRCASALEAARPLGPGAGASTGSATSKRPWASSGTGSDPTRTEAFAAALPVSDAHRPSERGRRCALHHVGRLDRRQRKAQAQRPRAAAGPRTPD